MPHAYTATRSRRGTWARYNARISKDRGYARRIAEQKIALKIAKREASERAEVESTKAFVAPVLSRVKAETVEVVITAGGESRTMRASFIPGFGWQGDSGNLMCRQIRVVREAVEAA